jgi:UDP:flavonoid glycosyltransferase YjiC (YdhE family)
VKCLLVPLGSAGDIHPFIGLGLALRERGHDVTVITGGHAEALLRRVGLPFRPIGTDEEYRAMVADPAVWHPRKGFAIMMKWIAILLPRVYEAVAALYEPGRTVVAAGSLGLGARVAQEKLGVPLATVHLAPGVFYSAYEPPVMEGLPMPAWLPRAVKRLMFRLVDALLVDRALAGPVNAFRASLGLPPVRHIYGRWVHSPQRVLGLFPDWYAPPQPDWPAQVRLTGFPLYDESGAAELPSEVDRFLDTGEPPLVFTPGSAMATGHDFFAAAVEACRLLGRRGLLLTRYPEQLPADLPDGVRHFDYVPFSRVLPHSAALVHHGGIGTTAQGLAAGVPQLLMPMSYDQPDNAARLRRLGVGASLRRPEFRGPAVAEALERLLGSEDMAKNCRAAAGRLQNARAVERACEELEGLAV